MLRVIVGLPWQIYLHNRKDLPAEDRRQTSSFVAFIVWHCFESLFVGGQSGEKSELRKQEQIDGESGDARARERSNEQPRGKQ